MSKVKLTVGLLLLIGTPLIFGAIAAGSAYAFATQHVRDLHPLTIGGHAIVKVSEFDHSAGAIAAAAGGIAVAWLLISIGGVALGGWMIANRNRSW